MSVRSKLNRDVEVPSEPEYGRNELPEGWASGRFDSITELNPRHPSGLDDSQLVTFVPMTCVSESSPDFDRSNERPLAEVRKGYTHFADGDVLFAKITPCMENGKGAVATGLKNGLGCGTTELHVIRPLGGIDSHYVYRFLQQESVRRDAAANFTGSAGQLRAPMSFIAELELPLPPLAEQRRIVRKLELLLGKVSSNQQRLSRVPGLLKRFRQSVLAAACSGKLTADWREENDIVEDWASTILEEIGHVTGGITKNSKRESLPLKIPYLRVANVYANRLELADVTKIGVTPAEATRTKLEACDLLFVEGNGSLDQIGRVAIWDGSIPNCVHQNHIIKFRANEGVEPRFVLLSMMSPLGRERLMEKAVSSAGLHSLSISKIAAIETELPPLPEQQEIVRRVEKLFAFADQIEARLRQAQAHVDRLTQSLLAKAFRGELVPTEHALATAAGREYESASELLAQIQAEQNSTTATDKPKRKRVQQSRGSSS